jgi:Undecaprenyl-phosphate glucose phosphotransferase
MHVHNVSTASTTIPTLDRQRSIRWRRAFGVAGLALVLAADVTCVGLASWAVTLHWTFSARQILAFLSVYGVAAALIAFNTSGASRRRDRILIIAALVGGQIAASGALTAHGVTGSLVLFASAAAAATIFEKATRRIHVRVLVWLRPLRTIAFVGNSFAAARMLAQLEAEDLGGVDVIGFFDDRHSRGGPLSGRIPRIGGVDEVVAYLQEHPLSEVYVALPWSASQRMAQLLERLRFLPLTVRLIPDHLPPSVGSSGRARIDDVVMPTLMVPPFSSLGGVAKRCIDIAVACVLIVPLTPLFLIVAALIKLDSSGPVFFRQSRSGQFGRSFMIYKFRSLHQKQQDAAAETLVTRGDARVTRVGRYLRKYSIDELPQILNVFFGHMSLVGPRPHAPRAKANGRIYSDVLPEYALRYRVKPGMTGWAQVNGWRGNTDTEDQLRRRVEFDFDYIGRWSMWRDIVILVRTVPSMLMPPVNNT